MLLLVHGIDRNSFNYNNIGNGWSIEKHEPALNSHLSEFTEDVWPWGGDLCPWAEAHLMILAGRCVGIVVNFIAHGIWGRTGAWTHGLSLRTGTWEGNTWVLSCCLFWGKPLNVSLPPGAIFIIWHDMTKPRARVSESQMLTMHIRSDLNWKPTVYLHTGL